MSNLLVFPDDQSSVGIGWLGVFHGFGAPRDIPGHDAGFDYPLTIMQTLVQHIMATIEQRPQTCAHRAWSRLRLYDKAIEAREPATGAYEVVLAKWLTSRNTFAVTHEQRASRSSHIQKCINSAVAGA